MVLTKQTSHIPKHIYLGGFILEGVQVHVGARRSKSRVAEVHQQMYSLEVEDILFLVVALEAERRALIEFNLCQRTLLRACAAFRGPSR